MYSVTQASVTQLLGDVRAERIAIPELQRPFVWDSVKVRDLMDSLYKGYPVGLPDHVAIGRGGSQGRAGRRPSADPDRRTAADHRAASRRRGLPVVDKKYRSVRIRIAFNPVTQEFATLTPVIKKNSEWIPDIAALLQRLIHLHVHP